MDRLYSRMLEFAGDGVYRYAFDDGRVLAANRGFMRILDLDGPPESILGRPIDELIVDAEHGRTLRRLLEERGEIRGLEFHFKTLKGEDRWVLHDSFLADDPAVAGRVAEAIVKDITSRKLGERRLAEESGRQERRLRMVFDGMLDAFALHEILCDAEGRPIDYRFLHVNRRFEEMTGLSADRIAGKTVREVIPGIESMWIEFLEVSDTGCGMDRDTLRRIFDPFFSANGWDTAPCWSRTTRRPCAPSRNRASNAPASASCWRATGARPWICSGAATARST